MDEIKIIRPAPPRESTLASCLQAVALKRKWMEADRAWDSLPALRRFFTPRPREPFREFSMIDLERMTGIVFEDCFNLRRCFNGSEGPESFTCKAELYFDHNGDASVSVRTEDHESHLEHSESYSFGRDRFGTGLSRDRIPSYADRGNRMTYNPDVMTFHRDVDDSVNRVTDLSREKMVVADIRRGLVSARAHRSEVEAYNKAMSGLVSKTLDALRGRGKDDLKTYVRCVFGMEALKAEARRAGSRPDIVARYRGYETCLYFDGLQDKIGNALAAHTASGKDRPSMSDIIGAARESTSLDLSDSGQRDFFYRFCVHDMRRCGYNTLEIADAVEKDAFMNGYPSYPDVHAVARQTREIDNYLAGKLEESVRESFRDGISEDMYRTPDFSGEVRSRVSGWIGRREAGPRHVDVKPTDISLASVLDSRLEDPVGLQDLVPSPSVPVGILRDKMVLTALNFRDIGDGRLEEFLRDTGVVFADGESVSSAFARAAARMYGDGDAAGAGRVKGFTDKWEADIRRAKVSGTKALNPKVPRSLEVENKGVRF